MTGIRVIARCPGAFALAPLFAWALIATNVGWAQEGKPPSKEPPEISREALAKLKPNPEAEEFVRQEVEGGRVANLIERFPDVADRVVSASFLEELISRKELPRQGVRVGGAIVLGELNLRNADIKHEVGLKKCIFGGDVNFRDARARRVLDFEGSRLLGSISFHRLRADSSIFIRGVQFHGSVDAVRADISGELNADDAVFYREANFNGMKAEGIIIKEAVFHGPVNFGMADMGINLEANWAKFLNKNAKADFNGIMVGGSVFLDKVEFHGPADFGHADVGGQLSADRAEFLNKEAKANFNGMKAKGVFIRFAQFRGPADFGWANLRINFEANGAKFLNEKGTTNFNSIKVGGAVFLRNVNFHGLVNFEQAEIGGRLVAIGAKFLNEETEAHFESIKVGEDVSIERAEFHGPVDFSHSSIGGHLDADEAKFLNEKFKANFNSIKVVESVLFDGTTFKGPVSISDAILESLWVEDLVVEAGSSLSLLRLDRTVISKLLRIEGTRLGVFSARDLQAQTIELWDIGLPKKGKLDLEGMTYERIEVKRNGAEELKHYRNLLKQARYSRQPYQQMAEFFMKKGETNRFRRILIDMHWREGNQKDAPGWLWNRTKFLTIGYSYRSWLLVVWALVVIFLSSIFAFKPRAIEAVDRSNNVDVTWWNRVLYSLSLILPVVELPIEKAWKIKPDAGFAWSWAHIQPLLGWVLAGILVAVFSGWVK